MFLCPLLFLILPAPPAPPALAAGSVLLESPAESTAGRDESAPGKAESAAAKEARYRALGLVDVREIDPSIFVDLVYAEKDNILGRPIYHDLHVCYLRREAALKLRDAGRALRRRSSGLHLLVYDGMRPRSAQKELWDAVADTPLRRYVADPARGSMHNYGMAVDLTLCDSTGTAVDMGSGYDELGPLAQPQLEARLLREGKLTRAQVERRRLLRSVMSAAGFRPLAIEWWHFQLGDPKKIRRALKIVE